MMVIPTQAVPSQSLTVTLNGQLCAINIYQKESGLYLDLYNAATTPPTLIIGGVLCENRNRIVRSAYLGFVGDLFFLDTQGNSDPVYSGLDGQYVLEYMDTAEIAAALAAAALNA